MNNQKIKLVVVAEHTLGYIFPEQPKSVHILWASILKGSPYSNNGTSINFNPEQVRLATEKDFDAFSVSFDGYRGSEEYEYAT